MPQAITTQPGSRTRSKLRPPSRHTLAGAVLALAALAVMASVPILKSPFRDFDAYGRALRLPAPDFRLRSTSGQEISLHDFRGQFVYLMFGYLGCDQVCHSQALTFHLLSRRVRDEAVQFLYLGMDPERDTPERIRQYFDARSDNFTGLVAKDMAEAQAVAADYHAYFSAEPTGAATGYRINHPGVIYLIDPSGEIRVTYSGAMLSVDRMLDDLTHLYTEDQR